MYYCSECHLLNEEPICSECGKKKLGEVQADEFCFLLEQGKEKFRIIFETPFETENIRYVCAPAGSTVGRLYGFDEERVRVYVAYSDYEKAKSIVDDYYKAQTEDAKAEIFEKWEYLHYTERFEKKLRKKYKIPANVKIPDLVREIVQSATEIKMVGIGSQVGYYIYSGEYFLVIVGELLDLQEFKKR